MSNKKILLSPISRLTIFFSVGIFLSDTILRCHNYLLFHIILLLLLALFSLFLYYRRNNILFGITTALFSVVLGSMLTNIKWLETEHSWQKSNKIYNGRITDEVVDKGRYIQFVVYVDNNKVLTRVMKDSVDLSFRSGDLVTFYGKIKRPANMGNPNEIDYATYLLHNGIYGTTFLQDDEIKSFSSERDATLIEKSLLLRERVISLFREWGISGDELALLSALMVGERNLFSQEVEDDYTKSGLAHMLSISGMHVGILLLIINFMLWFMNRSTHLRIMKWIILFVVLWGFACISGLAPSAVRAVIMCLFLELMYFSHEKRYPLNIIFVTALCMLIYNPFYLFDISFQLSFAAVISIILFYTPIMDMMRCRYRVVNSFSSVIALSISAQIGAAPLVLYYFSNFSSYFLLSNILSSFLVVVIMVVALISFVVPFQPIHILLLYALKAQNSISSTVAALPMSVVRIDNFSFVNILFIYILFIILLLYIYNRRRKYLIGVSILLLTIVSFNFVNSIPTKIMPHALIYNDSRMSYIHFVENRKESVVIYSPCDSLYTELRPAVKRYCYKNGIKEPKLECDYRSSYLYSCDGIIYWRGKIFCVVSDKRWKYRYTSEKPLEVDYLYLSRGFYGSISSLEKIFKIKKIILGFSLSDTSVEAITKECIDKGISYVNLKEVGYYKIMV